MATIRSAIPSESELDLVERVVRGDITVAAAAVEVVDERQHCGMITESARERAAREEARIARLVERWIAAGRRQMRTMPLKEGATLLAKATPVQVWAGEDGGDAWLGARRTEELSGHLRNGPTGALLQVRDWLVEVARHDATAMLAWRGIWPLIESMIQRCRGIEANEALVREIHKIVRELDGAPGHQRSRPTTASGPAERNKRVRDYAFKLNGVFSRPGPEPEGFDRIPEDCGPSRSANAKPFSRATRGMASDETVRLLGERIWQLAVECFGDIRSKDISHDEATGVAALLLRANSPIGVARAAVLVARAMGILNLDEGTPEDFEYSVKLKIDTIFGKHGRKCSRPVDVVAQW